jgi:hypothetical protein
LKIGLIMGNPNFIRLFTFFIIIIYASSVNGQQSKRPGVITAITSQKPGEGRVEINQDKKIDDLLRKYIDLNSQKTTITGYSICIFSQSKQSVARTKATQTRANFISNFPGIDATMRYEAPDWRVFVGNFRSRTDAFRLKKQIESMFPNAYIVETQIELSKL